MTIGDLKAGAMLMFGKYGIYNDAPQPIIWLKATPNSDFITLNAVDYICFDAKEPATNEYQYTGNPAYRLSNIHSFLNSDAEEWFFQTHQADAPPTQRNVQRRSSAYDSHFGFLYHFEEYELDSIKFESFEVNGEPVTSLVRLPSYENILGANRFKVFAKRGIRPKATEDMLYGRTSHDFEYESYVPFWINDYSRSGQAAVIGRSGACERHYASDCSGLRPVCTLKPDTPVLKREDGIYYIEPRVVRQNVYTDEELFELLGMAQP